jgi:hypothetical protein
MLTVTTMKTYSTTFLDIIPCSLVKVKQSSWVSCRLHFQGDGICQAGNQQQVLVDGSLSFWIVGI